MTPDCKVLPGFPGCGQTLPLSGKLAVYDSKTQLVQVLDFSARQDLQVKPKAGSKSLEWQDKGNSLTAVGSDNQPSLAWINPVSSKTPSQPVTGPAGQPVLRSSDGGTAWLEQKDGRFLFHVRLAGSAQEQTFPAESQPSDKIHDLLGWVPGTQLILAGYHFGSNSMWITGDQLYTLDARSGAIKELPASMHIKGSFSWHPSQPGVLAFGDTRQAQFMGAARLAILDITSGKVTHLITDAAVSTTDPVWLPDGSAILHASQKGGTPAANDPFTQPGIYRTLWPAGTTTLLTTPPQGSRDGWPQPEADGKNFLYLRYHPDTKQGDVRLSGIDGKLDAPIANTLDLAPAVQPLTTYWPAVLAYTP